MSRQFSETAPGGAVSGRKTVRRQSRGLVLEYEVSSTAVEPVSVRISERVPTADAEEFGFHEEHEPTEWTLSDGTLEIRVDLDPGAERTVVFGLVAAGDGLTAEQTEPSVAVEVRGGDEPGHPAEDGGAGGAEDDGAFFDRDGGSNDGAEPGGGVDLTEPSDGDHRPTEAAGGNQRVDADGGVVGSGGQSTGGVVSTLVDELEAGRVSESELATLRDHLGGERPESEAARLEYVQKRITDFDAYVDALEDLLSVHGSGEDAVTELEGRLDDVADDVSALRQRQDEVADRVDDLAAAVEDHAETVESLQVAHEEDVTEVRSELQRRGETVREELDELRRSVDDDLAALEAEIEAFESIRRTLVDGLRRPEEPAVDRFVGDAEPETDDETGDVPAVEPSESRREDPADEAGAVDETGDVDEPGDGHEADGVDESDEVVDGGGDATAWSPDPDRHAEERLETAAASNYSDSDTTTDDGAAAVPETDDGADDAAPEADDEPVADAAPVLSLEEASDDEEVSPDAPDDPDDPDLTSDGEQHDDEQDEAEGWMDDDGRPDDGFVSPVLDEDDAADDGGDALGEDADGSADADRSEDGDSSADADEAAGFEVPELDAADADGVDDAVSEAREDTEADDAGEEEGRATSIFEIGDVDAGAGGDEDKPTIDFEDG